MYMAGLDVGLIRQLNTKRPLIENVAEKQTPL